MNPWMNTNEAANNLEKEKQDSNHKAVIGKLTELVRESQQSELLTLRTENAALKEQVAQWETEYNGCSALLNNAERTIETLEETIAQQAERIVELNKECNSHYETCQQQAEAIRLKDAALDRCIGEFNLRLDDIDLSQETIRVLSARHIQPSPEHLEAWYKSMVGEPVAWNYELTEEAFVRLSVAGINVDTPLHAIKPFPFKGV